MAMETARESPRHYVLSRGSSEFALQLLGVLCITPRIDIYAGIGDGSGGAAVDGSGFGSYDGDRYCLEDSCYPWEQPSTGDGFGGSPDGNSGSIKVFI